MCGRREVWNSGVGVWSAVGWIERNRSILTTLEPGTIMPPSDLAIYDAIDEASVRQCRPSAAIERGDQQTRIAIVLGGHHCLGLASGQALLPII
jgi:hypothetical protein